jgi:hypothetical protein
MCRLSPKDMAHADEVEKIRTYIQDHGLGIVNAGAAQNLIAAGVRMQPGDLKPTWYNISKEAFEELVEAAQMSLSQKIKLKALVKESQDSEASKYTLSGDHKVAREFKSACAWIFQS